MNDSIWRSNWFLGLVVTLLFIIGDQSTIVQSLERTAYDWGLRLATRAPKESPVAIIAIDDDSIANLGRWPWSRKIHAHLTDTLAQSHAKVIANTVFFLEEQVDPGTTYLKTTRQLLQQSALSKQLPLQLREQGLGELSQLVTREVTALDKVLNESIADLNNDQRLADSLRKAGNVLLAMPFRLGQPLGQPATELPDYVTRNTLVTPSLSDAQGNLFVPTNAATVPIPVLGKAASGIGHINLSRDVDGAIRQMPLVLEHFGALFPSMPLLAAAKGLNLQPEDILILPGEGIQLGRLRIRTDAHLLMNTFFYQRTGQPHAFPVDSFFDVYKGNIPADKYRDKIVLIGPTATGVGTPFPTPVSPAMSPVEILAHIVNSIVQADFFVQPEWSLWAKIGAYLLLSLYLIFLLPRLRAGPAAIITILLLAALFGNELYLMVYNHAWLPLMGPTAMLVTGYLLLITKGFLMSEEGKLRSDAESAESNRMLGLAFQAQGQLEMAFDKFRKCPLEDSMMEVLYNLGMDFERKRQYGKAVSVYRYMSDHRPDFRDLKQRLARSTTMENTVITGGGSSTTTLMAQTVVDEHGNVQKPMLGRYELERELGKGAMGIVYLGRDPKINRVVAIKTMALSDEFEADDLEQVKMRFFREAESAGRLNHPNIVTIYDTGEEHDLAYIAMEFLTGRDLTDHIKKGHLLPYPQVIQIVAKTAVALDYAHQNDVVHRDIKPANIMYDPDKHTIKITDFGIARLTDGGRTKTKTGMVLGTPYYMSPEQIGGQKVDGRSDIFSLGVMFYQMLTGQLPFYAKDMASLLYQITQADPPDLLDVRPDLPPCLGPVVQRALAKDPARRYQRGGQFARDLVKCLKSVVQG